MEDCCICHEREATSSDGFFCEEDAQHYKAVLVSSIVLNEQLSLPFVEEMIQVHCFFHCPYVAQALDPQEAHDLMERHYTEKHQGQIARIVGRFKSVK